MSAVSMAAAAIGAASMIDVAAGSIEIIANEGVDRAATITTIDAGNGALRSAGFLSRYGEACVQALRHTQTFQPTRLPIVWRNDNGAAIIWNSNGLGGYAGVNFGIVDPS
jgi:hypothetical protein